MLEVGSHDLCNPHLPIDFIIEELVDLCNLFFRCRVKHVIICDVLGFVKLPYDVYNERVDIFNDLLFCTFIHNESVTVWKHKGFRQDINKYIRRNGIHPHDRGFFFDYIEATGVPSSMP